MSRKNRSLFLFPENLYCEGVGEGVGMKYPILPELPLWIPPKLAGKNFEPFGLSFLPGSTQPATGSLFACSHRDPDSSYCMSQSY